MDLNICMFRHFDAKTCPPVPPPSTDQTTLIRGINAPPINGHVVYTNSLAFHVNGSAPLVSCRQVARKVWSLHLNPVGKGNGKRRQARISVTTIVKNHVSTKDKELIISRLETEWQVATWKVRRNFEKVKRTAHPVCFS